MNGNDERTRADHMADIARKIDALGIAIKATMFHFTENEIPTDKNRVINMAWQFEEELHAISEELQAMAEKED